MIHANNGTGFLPRARLSATFPNKLTRQLPWEFPDNILPSCTIGYTASSSVVLRNTNCGIENPNHILSYHIRIVQKLYSNLGNRSTNFLCLVVRKVSARNNSEKGFVVERAQAHFKPANVEVGVQSGLSNALKGVVTSLREHIR